MRTHTKKMRPVARISFLAAMFCVLCSQAAAFAQGCASCYTTAAAGGSQTIHALRSGILVLLFPPILIFCGIVMLVWRWRSRFSVGSTEKI